MSRNNTQGIVRKQSLIERTRRNVIIWSGGAATVVGVLAVVSTMIIQTGFFNKTVIERKQETLGQIKVNVEKAPELKKDINKLNFDDNLLSVRASEDSPGLQVILDALPADGNQLALGASLQQKIFNVPGVTIDTLTLDTSAVDDSSTGSVVSEDGDELKTLEFAATISGSPNEIREALVNLESSIRSIDVKYMNGSTQGSKVSINLTGSVYYYPPIDLKLGSEVIKGDK